MIRSSFSTVLVGGITPRTRLSASLPAKDIFMLFSIRRRRFTRELFLIGQSFFSPSTRREKKLTNPAVQEPSRSKRGMIETLLTPTPSNKDAAVCPASWYAVAAIDARSAPLLTCPHSPPFFIDLMVTRLLFSPMKRNHHANTHSFLVPEVCRFVIFDFRFRKPLIDKICMASCVIRFVGQTCASQI